MAVKAAHGGRQGLTAGKSLRDDSQVVPAKRNHLAYPHGEAELAGPQSPVAGGPRRPIELAPTLAKGTRIPEMVPVDRNYLGFAPEEPPSGVLEEGPSNPPPNGGFPLDPVVPADGEDVPPS